MTRKYRLIEDDFCKEAVILLQNCTLNEQTLSYSLRSPFDKLIEADYHDWKDIIAHNFKELSSIEYNLKAINLKED